MTTSRLPGYPPGVANRLYQFRLEDTARGGCRLLLPPYYASLFRHYNGDLLDSAQPAASQTVADDWEELELGEISAQDRARVEGFLRAYQQLIMLGPSSFIRQHFDADLDAALSLDFNYLNHEQRTALGHLEFRAKWQQSADAIGILAEHLAEAVERLPCQNPSGQACLTYVPQYHKSDFHLPRRLAAATYDQLVSEGSGARAWEYVDCSLSRSKDHLKELALEDKLACWRQLIDADAITLSASVAGKTVSIVDDLYQSGATMWSMARFLKSRGAAEVLGLACVKSVKDTDNL